jgi:CheY-like chemotaxis protein
VVCKSSPPYLSPAGGSGDREGHERETYPHHTWSEAEPALALLQREQTPIDVLITDVVLPGIKGPQVERAVRERWPNVSVVVVSGHASEMLARRGYCFLARACCASRSRARSCCARSAVRTRASPPVKKPDSDSESKPGTHAPRGFPGEEGPTSWLGRLYQLERNLAQNPGDAQAYRILEARGVGSIRGPGGAPSRTVGR